MGLLQAKACLLDRERLEVVRSRRLFRPSRDTLDAFNKVQIAIKKRKELTDEAMGKLNTSPAAE
jgi:hypothetical protein